jgi:hypothetical protein
MATKQQTLKSLFGMTDYRKDVTLDSLGQVALGNKIDASSGYSVATPQTPKTNALLQLAADLKRVPQIYGQAKNIAQNKAIKDVSELSQTEIVSEMSNKDKETMSIFGYDRAYQHGVVQRYLAVKEPEIQQGFLNMANDPEMLKLDAGEFVDALGKKRTEFFEDLSNQFGGNANREEAFNVLGGAVADSLVATTSKAFLKNKEHQAIAFKSANFNENVPKMGFTKAMNLFRSEMQGLFFLSPKEIKEKMHTTIAARVETLEYNGEYETAREEIKEAMNYSLYKGATLGKVAEDRAKLTKLLANIDAAEEKEDKEFTENYRGVRRAFDVALNGLATPDVSLDVFKTDFGNGLKRAGMSQSDIEPLLKQIEEKPNIQEFINIVSNAARGTENQNVFNLLSSQLTNLREVKSKYFSAGAHTIGSFKDSDMPSLKSSIRETLNLNPKTPLSQLPDIAGGRAMSRNDPMYIAAVNEVLEEFNWERVPSQKDELISLTMKTITSREAVPVFRELALEYSGRIQADLNDAAPALWQKSDNNIQIYNQLLQNKSNELYKEYEARATARLNAQALIDQAALGVKTKKKVDKTAKGADEVRDLPSFKRNTGANFVTPTSDEVISDRAAIDTLDLDDSDKKRLKQANLIRWGFWSRESIDLNLMSEADLGFRDVRLNAYLLRDASLAQRVYEANEKGEELEPYTTGSGDTYTVEQLQESAEFWKTLGFDSVEDFNTLETIQERLRN